MSRLLYLLFAGGCFLVACCWLPGCQEVEAASLNQFNEHNLIFQFDAAELVSTLKQEGDDSFSAVILRYLDKELVFQKARIEEASLVSVPTKAQPLGTIVTLGADGEVHPQTDDLRASTFEFWSNNFDFGYFDWATIKLIAQRSDKVYVSGSMITYGSSVHYMGDEVQAKTPYFTFKLEGDYLKKFDPASGGENIPDPMIVQASPCPPTWQIGEGE